MKLFVQAAERMPASLALAVINIVALKLSMLRGDRYVESAMNVEQIHLSALNAEKKELSIARPSAKTATGVTMQLNVLCVAKAY
ncbi:hypothetical protein [Mariprofundus micogutta]|nr:hypothetical protein [Mariprofundus micogutta]